MYLTRQINLIVWIVLSGIVDAGQVQQKGPSARARNQLVDSALIPSGISDPRVIKSIRATLRHEFVPRRQRDKSYFDMALPIGGGQTISPPYIVAFMTEKLEPQPTDRVLEIGTGSGYQAAVLSPLVAEVYSIEIVESLGIKARGTLQRLGYKNVHTKIGDGYAGWPEHAPFDKIIVTCSPEEVPQALVDQLAEDGRIVIPLGDRFQQTLYRLRKKNGELRREALEGTFFVPMTGAAESHRKVQIDETRPQVSNTSFEETTDDPKVPLGWYYLRQATVIQSDEAPDGKRYLNVKNEIPGRMAHTIQSFGVDGKTVRTISVSAHVRGTEVKRGPSKDEGPSIIVEFYSASRAPAGRHELGRWSGTFDWQQESQVIPVPQRAILGVVGIGLFGGTGTLDFDQVQLRAEKMRKAIEKPSSGKEPSYRSDEPES